MKEEIASTGIVRRFWGMKNNIILFGLPIHIFLTVASQFAQKQTCRESFVVEDVHSYPGDRSGSVKRLHDFDPQ